MKTITVNNIIKVLHPITRLIVGGAQENTLFTAQYLNPSRYDVHVLTGRQTGSEGSLFHEAADNGIKVKILPDLVREISPQYDYMAFKKLTNLLRYEKFVIVHTHSSKAGILGRMAAQRSKVPIILHTVHGWSFHEQMHPALRMMYILLEKLAYRYSDAIIFVSKKDIELGKNSGILSKENYHLVRSAIPIDKFQRSLYSRSVNRENLGIPHDVPVIGNIGRFSAQKDPLSWIKVAKLVHAILPDCQFLLVGDGPLKLTVETEIQRTGFPEKFIMTGIRRDVPEMLSAMDIFLITSLWEGLPRVIPQALSMGLPVVSNHINGIEEVVIDGRTGFLAEPGNIQLLADHCIRLLQEPANMKMLGENGMSLVRREFSLDRMICQIEAIYEELIRKKIRKT